MGTAPLSFMLARMALGFYDNDGDGQDRIPAANAFCIRPTPKSGFGLREFNQKVFKANPIP